jgi:hypothetical protein
MVPIQHEDDHSTDHKVADCLLPSSSSAMITSETSMPVKGEAESSSASVVITSETSTPIKEKFPPFSGDISMESLHFKQIRKKLKEFENTENIVKKEI